MRPIERSHALRGQGYRTKQAHQTQEYGLERRGREATFEERYDHHIRQARLEGIRDKLAQLSLKQIPYENKPGGEKLRTRGPIEGRFLFPALGLECRFRRQGMVRELLPDDCYCRFRQGRGLPFQLQFSRPSAFCRT
jgi:hypothetical protein